MGSATCDDPFHATFHVHICSYLSSTTADEIAGLKRLNQTALYVGVCRCLELGAHLTTHTRHKLATSKAAAALAQDKVDDLSKQLAELQSRTTSRISELEVEAANNASEATSLREQLARANDRTAQLQRERDDAAAATSNVEKDLRQLQQRSEEQRSALETELREAREACTIAETVRALVVDVLGVLCDHRGWLLDCRRCSMPSRMPKPRTTRSKTRASSSNKTS